MSSEGQHKSVTIRLLHRLFALSVSFSAAGENLRRGLQVGDKPEWHGVKHIQPSSIDFGCVSIGSGMNEKHHGRGKGRAFHCHIVWLARIGDARSYRARSSLTWACSTGAPNANPFYRIWASPSAGHTVQCASPSRRLSDLQGVRRAWRAPNPCALRIHRLPGPRVQFQINSRSLRQP